MPRSVQKWCPKELAVAVVFAAGTCLASWTQQPKFQIFALPASLFAALCCLNCMAIESWEWISFGSPAITCPHPLTLWLARRTRSVALGIALVGTVLFFIARTPQLFAAITLSALGFAWLDLEKERLSVNAFRVLADVPLLSPLILLIGSI